ncbi:TadE family protein [Sphingomicrobium sp. XHP0239]|uniref:TadE/TadG family type IV pilus assembly protein n=1 Tax=Sphingomicrobium maritimum TaxID=3133972 RepID=UPI0031CCB512
MKTLPRTIARDERGSATIELAIVAPMLAVMITGVVDLSMAYSRKLEIEQGAQRAIEKVMQTTTTETVHTTLKAEAAAAARVPLNQVTVKYIIDCDGTETDISADVAAVQAAIDAKIAAGEDPADVDKSKIQCTPGQQTRFYITLNITDSYEPVLDPRYVGFGDANGRLPIDVTTGIRTK